MVTPEEFGETLEKAIIEEGAKEGADARKGNPVRKEFIKLYGTDEKGFVKQAVDNLNKTPLH